MRNSFALLLSLLPALLAAEVMPGQSPSFIYEIVTDGLDHPWSLAFLPDGRMLVTERPGRLRLISAEGVLHSDPVGGLPHIRQHGQGGLLDVVLHPDFKNNQLVYFSFAEADGRAVGTAVARGQLRGHRLEQVEVIFRLLPKSNSKQHFGSRLVFDNNGYLFITLGDRHDRPRAQDLNDHAGSLIRLHDDGRIPADNPFVNRSGTRAEIFSYGHRNMQGAAVHPVSGKLWIHEHGPQGGDELNIPQAGVNYGWPVITYGRNYVTGTRIGEGTHKEGMAQPVHYWTPSIAPSGMTFYTGNRFPQWKGNLFIGSLKFKLLMRLVLDGEHVVREERLLEDELGRIRDVRQGPDGLLYLLTDDSDGLLVRLLPDPIDSVQDVREGSARE